MHLILGRRNNQPSRLPPNEDRGCACIPLSQFDLQIPDAQRLMQPLGGFVLFFSRLSACMLPGRWVARSRGPEAPALHHPNRPNAVPKCRTSDSRTGRAELAPLSSTHMLSDIAKVICIASSIASINDSPSHSRCNYCPREGCGFIPVPRYHQASKTPSSPLV